MGLFNGNEGPEKVLNFAPTIAEETVDREVARLRERNIERARQSIEGLGSKYVFASTRPQEPPKRVLIGLIGKAGAGKDTVGDFLVSEYGFRTVSFAQPIRDMLRPLLERVGAPLSYMHDRKKKEEPIPGIGISYRHLAQTLGTEWGRSLAPDFWLRFMPHDAVRAVITDVRFPNEVEAIKSRGGFLLRVHRDAPAVRDHASEAHALTLPADFEIDNNGPLDELFDSVRALVERML